MGSGPISQQMVLEREVQGFGGVAQLAPGKNRSLLLPAPTRPLRLAALSLFGAEQIPGGLSR